ncbi:MAG: flagellin [Gallionellales bacterium CG_4_10_14_3_um_filter_54_96]|nr:MAG: flagellin [Gallionellaceae bacterium CG1_02_56_997]PIV14997.1 MAG: flagellin [Gallionellales bacterium CG03_land_8_20_14_0_80_55_15]PIV91114.1 MAG: flagellin [Gallionellales bacterium CG17_big_fil_post_rev_8_21_14_2_50_54_146]PIY05613.1 MAG: flagellin [Gallionellales bacterium CG_4_10_14_3_um_filter_54_96]HCJ50689.1 flagellin [Gallionella sp.]
MPSFINTNIASLNAQRNLNSSQSAQQTSLQRLSSGLRINSAKDDAAGLAISNRMSSQISGANQAARNANDGISLAQTAEGDLTQISNNLQRMRDLAVQSSNATNTASDRAALNNEVQALAQEIDRVAQNSSFNGVKLLDGSFTAQNFQIGANATANDSIQINAISSARISQIGGVGQTTSATVTGAATTAALTAGAVTLNGTQVGASNVGALPGQSAASAYSVANAINAVSGSSGVTATANATGATGAAATAFAAVTAGANSGFSINGVAVGNIAAGGDAIGQGANVAAAINLVAAQSGVTATANATTGALSLSAADGRDITIAANGTYATLAADTGLTAATTHGTVTLNSTSASGIVLSGGAVASGGFTAATTTATTVSNVSSIASMNVLTASSASAALNAIDGALSSVNTSRASLGAYQNRFASVVTSLQTTSENLTASRSRIQDTDFAAETASLTRAQILQQAGTAMLAQANQIPNQVMTLLR